MLNFNVVSGDYIFEVPVSPQINIMELKMNLVGTLDIDFDQFTFFLENVSSIDIEEMMDLPVECLELDLKKSHYLFLINKKNPEYIWKNYCSNKIFGLNNKNQKYAGYIMPEGFPVCYPCFLFCYKGKKKGLTIEDFSHPIQPLDNQCCCNADLNKKCRFDSCPEYKLEDNTLSQNINNIKIFIDNETKNFRTKLLAKKMKKYWDRNFDFEKSIQFGLIRVKMYEQKEVQEKILSILPLVQIQAESKENFEKQESTFEKDPSIKTPRLGYRDFLVKSLLFWFKYNFFTWCNQPICKFCNIIASTYIRTDSPSQEESNWAASRTEVYKCQSCNKESRFARYNNPIKLCDTKTGRCGEWANLFGAVLRTLKFEVRFIDNFEDHVWNEYYSDQLKRWIHVDSCENAWDTPLVYEQGWGREMTFILGHSISGVQDCTPRYVKEFENIKLRRSPNTEKHLKILLEKKTKELRIIFPPEEAKMLKIRDEEEADLFGIEKFLSGDELIDRQSGSEQWRLERGEMKKKD